jgi:phosphate:Na+ symporter
VQDTASVLQEILGPLIGGLGLFFVGVKMIGANLRLLSGPRLRQLVASSVSSAWRGSALGVLSGAITQSSSAITLILSNMIAANLMSVAQAVPIVAWANVGTSALVLASTVDIRIPVFYLLGLIGVSYFFDIDNSTRYRHIAGAMLGVGLVFLGLQLLHAGAIPLRDSEDFRHMLLLTARFDSLLFIVALVVAMLLQSSSTVSAIAVTMSVAGLLTLEQTTLIIFGASAGSGLGALLLSASSKGAARQLAVIQAISKTLGSLLMLALLVLEKTAAVPLVLALLAVLTPVTALQAAWAFLLTQFAGVLLGNVLAPFLLRVAARMSPLTRRETLSKPRYLSEETLGDAESAMDLAELEQTGLLEHLGAYLSEADPNPKEGAVTTTAYGLAARELAAADAAVSEEISRSLGTLASYPHESSTVKRLLALQNRQRLVGDLSGAVLELEVALQRIPALEDPNREFCLGIRAGIRESAHFLLSTLHECAATGSADDLFMLQQLTGDRSSTMDSLRKRWLDEASHTGQQMLDALFSATALFERTVWIIGRYVSTLSPDGSADQRL